MSQTFRFVVIMEKIIHRFQAINHIDLLLANEHKKILNSLYQKMNNTLMNKEYKKYI